MKCTCACSALAVFAFSPLAGAALMIPDSGAGDRIMLFNDFDGSLITQDWITDVGAVGWFFTTPKEAIQVGNEIWVSDQIADAIHRFDSNLSFIGSITAHPSGGSLDNLRGMHFDGSTVYLTFDHSTSAMQGVAMYDTTGSPTGFFHNPGSLFDIAVHNGQLLLSNSTSDDIEYYSFAGVFQGTFATDVDFPQQVSVLSDNSVLTVSSIASAGVEGVYHYNADGSLNLFIDTEGLKGAFGEHVPRGAYLLGNGDYLIATSNGVYTYDVGSDTFALVVADVNAQYINFTNIPAPGVLALLGLAGVAKRRRRM